MKEGKKVKELESKAFIAGMESAIAMIKENMNGGALRMFDLHSWQVEDLIRQLKKTIK